MEQGIVDRRSVLHCPGTIWIPHRFAPDNPELAQPFRCWAEDGHRSVNVVEAIAQSCDIYFGVLAGGYQEFEGLGQEALHNYTLLFGLGQPTGIELPGENAGLVPDETWKRLTYGETWLTGETYNVAIGQGFILATPLQVLNATAAIANDGRLYRPQLVREIRDVEGKCRPVAHHSRQCREKEFPELPLLRAPRDELGRLRKHGAKPASLYVGPYQKTKTNKKKKRSGIVLHMTYGLHSSPNHPHIEEPEKEET